MRKPVCLFFCFFKNEGADQLRCIRVDKMHGNRSVDQGLCLRYRISTEIVHVPNFLNL